MKKTLIFLMVLLVPVLMYAQESSDNAAGQAGGTPPPIPTAKASGNIACFDFYKFGSVQADIQPAGFDQAVPGASLFFKGNITNENDYPLVDGKLSVKIFRRDESTFSQGNGNAVVDQFTIQEGIALAAKGSQEVTFEWKVPANARGGEYYAAYFFTTSERYNLMGLSFTDDVVGNQAPFVITNPNDPKTAFLDKNSVTLNDRSVPLAAFPLHFAAEDAVLMKVKVQNPSDQIKSMPLQWNQYGWDAQREENRQNTKTELITLQPNEVRELSYQIFPSNSSVIFLTLTTQDGASKSIINTRYVRDGIEETRINFPSLTQFPLRAGQEQTLFACAHSTNAPVVKNNLLLMTLKDRQDQVVTQYRYEGDISGAMGGFGALFTPDTNYDYIKLEASLFRDGNEMEKVEIVYDCQKINPESCEVPESEWTLSGKNIAVIVIGIAGVLVVLGAILFSRRKRTKNIQW